MVFCRHDWKVVDKEVFPAPIDKFRNMNTKLELVGVWNRIILNFFK
jgi:hypothetical protein